MTDAPVALIVDGYNVIFRLFPEAGSGAEPIREARSRLEGELVRLAAQESVDVWVDYDGAEVTGVLPEMTTDPAIRVRYTEPPAEADDAIVQRARQLLDEGRRSVTVFSDDRELSRRVREVGASVENVDALALRLQRLHARTRPSPPEVPEEEARLRAIHERQERISTHAAEQDRQRALATTDETPDGRGPTAADGKRYDAAASEEERRRLRGRRRQARRLGQADGENARRGKRGKKKKKGRG